MKTKYNWWNPLTWLSCIWENLTDSSSEKASVKRSRVSRKRANPKINHDVEQKQVIKASSPTKKEQHKFIEEGGNSQPLKK